MGRFSILHQCTFKEYYFFFIIKVIKRYKTLRLVRLFSMCKHFNLSFWCIDDYVFDNSIFQCYTTFRVLYYSSVILFECYIIRHFECYTTFIVQELLYNIKSNFYFYFKKCRNLHKYNRNQHIKQHNKTILRYNKKRSKFQLLSKRSSLAELIFLFRTDLSRLINKLSLISRIYL